MKKLIIGVLFIIVVLMCIHKGRENNSVSERQIYAENEQILTGADKFDGKVVVARGRHNDVSGEAIREEQRIARSMFRIDTTDPNPESGGGYKTNTPDDGDFTESNQETGAVLCGDESSHDSKSYENTGTVEGGENEYSEPVSELVEPESVSKAEYEGFMDNSGVDEQGQSEYRLTYLGNWVVTFYCPCEICCGQWATGCTASGVLATEWHTVATGDLDFGTELYIEGLGNFVVEDRGTECGHVDVFVNDHQTALALGLQYCDVYLVG